MSENHVTEPVDGEDLKWPVAIVDALVAACRAAQTSSEFDAAINQAAEANGSQYKAVQRLVWGIAIGYRTLYGPEIDVPDDVPSTYGEQTMVNWWLNTKSEFKSRCFDREHPEQDFADMFGRSPEWCLRLIKYLRGGVDAGEGFGFGHKG